MIFFILHNFKNIWPISKVTWDEKKKAWFPKVINQHQYYSGLTKPGKVGEILALYQLKSLFFVMNIQKCS
jgi:hypothetical protein